MYKEIIIMLFLILVGGAMIILAKYSYMQYRCMTIHFPDRFQEIRFSDDIHAKRVERMSFNRCAAVYERCYVYNKNCYHLNVSDKEFNERFYICEDYPSRAYAESELIKAGKQLVIAGAETLIGIGLLAGAVLIRCGL